MRTWTVLLAGLMLANLGTLLQAQQPLRIQPVPIQPVPIQTIHLEEGIQVMPMPSQPMAPPAASYPSGSTAHAEIVQQAPQVGPTPPGVIGAAQYPSNQPRTAVGRWLNKCGVGCGGHHNWFGTGSFHSQFRFLWGSSRVFFSEPCLPAHPYPSGIGGYGLQSADTYYGSHRNRGERIIPGINGGNFLGSARPCTNCD